MFPLRHHRHLKLGLSLLLILAVLGHFAPGIPERAAYVLCFGADGHVAVEPGGHDHRAPDPGRSAGHHTEISAPFSGDGSCIDIPVAGNDHGSHAPFPEIGTGFGGLEWLALVALCFILLPSVGTVAAGFRPHRPPPADARVLLRRTVVLLI